MEFTYNAYKELLILLKENNYHDIIYGEKGNGKTVILRHDVDYSLEKALDIAIIENEMDMKSTYFILISSDFYNVFSKKSIEFIQRIKGLGHEVGLHFDEKKYNINNIDDIKKEIFTEIKIISQLFNFKVNTVSMHRPSQFLLNENLDLGNVINSYSQAYFKEMKYISDSRMNWRENPVENIISNNYKNLHILTHPFWYANESETMEHKIEMFINGAKNERYETLKNNITDLEKII
ncbi:polysaccharide deacetylase family protein [Planococcus salinarum]|uniref:hypothetical protein n=1 Tax=Planococcus salinarum TaxID=622695 RepID=UPI000E3BA328|nr:hypothetical protein [Planococcus salinarum]TAA72861.1 hypothetical protein D2909_04525 [Planococcus salinarum]